MLSQFVRASLALAVLAGAAQAGVTNQVWRRSTDWVPGSAQGSSDNNPGPVGGQAVWSYEWANGSGLASEDPWYQNTGHRMTWDGAWWGTGWGVWSKGDDNSPPILPGRLIHNVAAAEYANIPMVRWENPMGNGGVVNISGTLLVNWNGVSGLGRPDDDDVVIAKFSASTNTTVALYSNTVSKPNPFPSVGDSVLLPINLSNILMNQGDSIIITHRGQQSLSPLGAWINMYDGLTITSVPTPGAAGVLALAGLAAARRRRR
jgi:MYXO-CTERM domain-containing protein